VAMFSSISPFKKVQKTLSKTLQRASDFIAAAAPSSVKSFRAAILAGDEEKAILIYKTVTNGKSLEEELHPSLPFPLKVHDDQTPMHLACLKAMESLILLFIEHGGSPNALNANDETCLHAICRGADRDARRRYLIELMLQWRGEREGGGTECVSVNKVDLDGNTATHYGAASGLMECVILLAAEGAIISIVNKDQMTCCEMADSNNHKELADLLEAALVYPPPDQDMVFFDDESGVFRHENDPPVFLLDTMSYTLESLALWKNKALRVGVDALSLPPNRVEALLDHYEWDVERVVEEYLTRPSEVLSAANMTESYTQFSPIDPRGIDDLPSDIQSSTSTRSPSDNCAGDRSENKDAEIGLDGIILGLGGQDMEITRSPLQHIQPTDLLKKENASNVSAKSTVIAQNEPVGMCPVCSEDMYPPVPSALILSKSVTHVAQREIRCGAGHSFCLTCWATHLTMQINETGCPTMSCMGFKCGEMLDSEQWAEAILGSSVAEKLTRNRLRHIVDRHQRFRWCPAKDCGCLVHIDTNNAEISDPAVNTTPSPETELGEGRGSSDAVPSGEEPAATVLARTAICGNGHAFCLLCNAEAHAPCTCEDWAKWTEKIQKEIKQTEQSKSETADIASALWVAANTKRCPRCQMPIEKDEGCNHMTCKKCRHEFCWICMQNWDKHSNRTGGFFQCNIYADSKKISKDDEDMDDDEFGSSTKETMRARQRGRLMEKFIQHYTRFRAHCESYDLELRMHRATVHRICRVLHDSAVGATPWLQGESVTHPYLKEGMQQFKNGATSNASSRPTLSKSSASTDSWTEPPISQLEASDRELATLGDCRTKSEESPLLFLQNGFRELMKCRQILKGSFPLAYYTMSEEDDLLGSRYSMRSSQQRRQRRMYAESRREVFEQAQADLEALTETLSDVVARRRLRASNTQIARATRAARAGRLDLEAVIRRHYEAYDQDKKQEKLEQTQYAQSAGARRRSTGSRMNRGLESLPGDVDNLLQSMQLAGLSEADFTGPDPSSRRVRRALIAARERTPPHQRRRQPYTDPTSSRSLSRRYPHGGQSRYGENGNRFAARLARAERESMQQEGDVDSDSDSNNGTSSPPNDQEPSMREILLEAGWSEADIHREGWDLEQRPASFDGGATLGSRLGAMIAPPIENEEGSDPRGSSPYEMHSSAEEEEINRAILMSLQVTGLKYLNV